MSQRSKRRGARVTRSVAICLGALAAILPTIVTALPDRPGDLADAGAAEALAEQCSELDVRVLVNNAGCAVKNEEQLAHPDRMRAMMQLNVVTMTELCLRFGAQMVARGGGWVLNLGSMTAYVGASSLIGYASSKRYVISYSRELHSVFAPHGIRVACLVPGLTETSFFSASGVPLDTAAARRLGMLTPDQVAEQGYALTFAGPVVEICGAKNRWLARLSPWLPSFVIDRARRQLHGQAPGALVPPTAQGTLVHGANGAETP